VIAQIKATADKLRHELLADIADSDLQTCMRVLTRIRDRAEKDERRESSAHQPSARVLAQQNGQTGKGHSIPRRRTLRAVTGAQNET
jgi:hypothetical protein